MDRPKPVIAALAALGFLCVAGASACAPAPPRPNVLWIVWDTVRADRLSLYGYPRPTTPELERWAAGARVFEDCVTAASTTAPAHASMFTGLLPAQHAVSNSYSWLDERYVTVAEQLRDAGYRTFLWAANPHLGTAHNLQQGFGTVQHPWTPEHRHAAVEIVQRKTEPDRTSDLGRQIREPRKNAWWLAAAGERAQVGLETWLDAADSDQPWFAFLNYMEAHRPYVPERRHREALMTRAQLARSYHVDSRFPTVWSHTFGLDGYSEADLAVIGATYDAALHELDALLGELLDALRARGALDDTVVVLTSDHGEHLGEHHLLDHQYSVYEPVLRVPLVVHYPPRFAPGRDDRPVVNFDLFPTLLELAGAAPVDATSSRARSLLGPGRAGPRLSAYRVPFQQPFGAIRALHPDWSPGRFDRRLRAFRDDGWKLVWADDGSHELYHVRGDPAESVDRFESDPERAGRLLAALEEYVAGLGPEPPNPRVPQLDPDELRRLEALGYARGRPP